MFLASKSCFVLLSFYVNFFSFQRNSIGIIFNNVFLSAEVLGLVVFEREESACVSVVVDC